MATDRNYNLIILADIITGYYTCVETAFVRIAKAFENEAIEHPWHAGLLERGFQLSIPLVKADLERFVGFLDQLSEKA